LNYVRGVDAAASAIVPVSSSGEVCFFSSQTSDLVVDINGWFAT
jgi:hypothetical protein